MPSPKGTTQKAGSSATQHRLLPGRSIPGHSLYPSVTFLGCNFKLCFPRSLSQAIRPGALDTKHQRHKHPGVHPGHTAHSSRMTSHT